MEKKLCRDHFCLRGGLIGLLITVILFGFFFILNIFSVAFGENPLTVLLIFALSFIELPIVVIGRALGLPVEGGGVSFILYDLTALGYILTMLFWVFIGGLIGWIIEKYIRGHI